jgi:hypothetical protein
MCHLDLNACSVGRWLQFLVNLGRQESRTSSGTYNEEDPHRSPAIGVLERPDGKKTEGSCDGTASINESSNGTKGLVVAMDRRVRCQVSSNGGSDNIVGSKHTKGTSDSEM